MNDTGLEMRLDPRFFRSLDLYIRLNPQTPPPDFSDREIQQVTENNENRQNSEPDLDPTEPNLDHLDPNFLT
jgi:hypothetical protein